MFFKNLKKNLLYPDLFVPFIVAVLLGFVYLFTILPGIGYSGDTVKFQYTGYVLGTPHWPGYPTYIIINYLFTRLFPIGTIAFKANLLSALLGIAACLTLFNIFKKIMRLDRVTAFITSFFFGISFTFWSQALVAEVYTLAMLLLGLFLFYLFRWRQTNSIFYFISACAVYSVSFGNHIWMIILLPGFIYIVLYTDKTIIKRPVITGLVLLIILLGALQYGYIIWRYYAGSSYLEIIAPDIKSFFQSMNQMGVKSNFHFSTPKFFIQRLPMLFFFLIREFSILLPVSIFGLKRIWKKDKHIAIFILICCGTNICFVLLYNIYDIFIYMLITYFFLALCLGFGIEAIITSKKFQRFPKNGYLIILILIASIMFYNSRYVSMRGSTDKIVKTKKMIRSINNNSVIFSTGYFTTHCLNYYLVGNDMAQKRNIHLFDQIFYPNNIFLYLTKGVPLVNPKKPGIEIQPGLKVYVAMPFIKPEKLRHQIGVNFFRQYYQTLIKLNDFMKKLGIRILSKSYESISFPTRFEQKQQIIHDTLSDLKKLGLNAEEVTDDLYLITINNDKQSSSK